VSRGVNWIKSLIKKEADETSSSNSGDRSAPRSRKRRTNSHSGAQRPTANRRDEQTQARGNSKHTEKIQQKEKTQNSNMKQSNATAVANKRGSNSRPGNNTQKSDRPSDKQRRTNGGSNRRRVVETDHYTRRRRERTFEAPLPEDLAFRPKDAGGDSTLLPEIRHRPRRHKSTDRLIESGPRTLGGWINPSDETSKSTQQKKASDLNRSKTDSSRRQAEHSKVPSEKPKLANELKESVPTQGTSNSRTYEADTNRQQPEQADTSDKTAEFVKEIKESSRIQSTHNSQNDEPTTNREQSEQMEISDKAAESVKNIEESPRTQNARNSEEKQGNVLKNVGTLPEEFRKLGLQDLSLEVFRDMEFVTPTPIQAATIPTLLAGKDVVGLAETGSGKTIAFASPMIETLDQRKNQVQGLVLVPTRELAQQVLDVISTLAKPWNLKTVGLLGGHALKKDFQALEGNPHIVVGTPGRVLDHLQRRTLSLRKVSFAVLDEADEMLDIGFLPAIRKILSQTPRARQTALFSATMPTTIKRLIWQFMEDPETLAIDKELSAAVSIQQTYVEVAERDKIIALKELIERELRGKSLVFCRTRRMVERLAKALSGEGIKVGALHGDMDQRTRDRVVKQFREGVLDLLVATNVAARGIDIPEITHVVHFDFPQNTEEYIHRTGRTGRAGKSGKSIIFVAEWDLEDFSSFQEELGNELTKENLTLYNSR
jgi:ATP-dependent RNA helicase DeaD